MTTERKQLSSNGFLMTKCKPNRSLMISSSHVSSPTDIRIAGWLGFLALIRPMTMLLSGIRLSSKRSKLLGRFLATSV